MFVQVYDTVCAIIVIHVFLKIVKNCFTPKPRQQLRLLVFFRCWKKSEVCGTATAGRCEVFEKRYVQTLFLAKMTSKKERNQGGFLVFSVHNFSMHVSSNAWTANVGAKKEQMNRLLYVWLRDELSIFQPLLYNLKRTSLNEPAKATHPVSVP